MRKRNHRFNLFSILFFLIAICCFNFCGCNRIKSNQKEEEKELVKTTQLGPVDVKLSVTPKEPSLADTITFIITVRSKEGVELTLPEFGESLGEFMIIKYSYLPLRVEEGYEIRGQKYTIETLKSGKFVIPPINIKFKVSGKDYNLKTEELNFIVHSLGKEQLTDIHEINPVVSLPKKEIAVWIWILLAAGGLALIIGVLVYILYPKKKVEVEEKRTPEEIALEALRDLLAKDYIGQMRYREFYFEITMIVREYIERRYQIHAPTQTTEEFLQDMSSQDSFPFSLRKSLKDFMIASDIVKYAAWTPNKEDIEASFDTAKTVVGINS